MHEFEKIQYSWEEPSVFSYYRKDWQRSLGEIFLYCDYLCECIVTGGMIMTNNNLTARVLLADLYGIRRESEKVYREKGRSKSLLHMTSRLASIAKVMTKGESSDVETIKASYEKIINALDNFVSIYKEAT